MSIITRQERKRLVLDLYNQGKTIREIAKEARMSFRDIRAILNKLVEEKTEGSKEEQEQEVEHLSLSTQSYKLFCEGKTPLEVAIALNLEESEATKFCREYWKLKQLHNLNMVYEELRGDIEPFLKLYKLAKRKGIGVKQVVDTLAIANNDLQYIEGQLKKLRNEAYTLQSQKRICKGNLYQLNNRIATTSRLLNSFHISCETQRREIENLYNQKAKLESIVTEFKNNNEEYLKIKQVAEDRVKSVLMNGMILLKFATASVIESLRRNHELCNIILNDTDTTSYGSNHLSLILPEEQQPSNYLNDDDIYTAVLLEEAEKLYNVLTTKLTEDVMAADADIRTSSSSPLNRKDDRS